MPSPKRGDAQKNTHSGEFSHWSKSLPIIDSFNLAIALGNQACLETVNSAIGMVFDPLDPFAADWLLVNW